MGKVRSLIALAVATTLAACAVGPDYHAPDTTVAKLVDSCRGFASFLPLAPTVTVRSNVFAARLMNPSDWPGGAGTNSMPGSSPSRGW